MQGVSGNLEESNDFWEKPSEFLKNKDFRGKFQELWKIRRVSD